MINEVTNETEDLKQNETPVEETNTENSVETPAEQEQATPDLQASEPAATAASEPETSDEQHSANDIDFGAILEKFEQEQTVFHSGELVEGKVVGVSDRGVLIDFGYKSEGIAPIEDFTSPEGDVTVQAGDTVEVIIKSIYSGDAPPNLSRLDALRRKSWDIIEKAFNEEAPITGRVIEKTKGGLRVDLNGVEAFLPGSQVDSRPIRNLDSFRGQDIEAKIIKFSRKRNNIVLSRKVLTDEVVNKQKAETLNNIEEGYVVEGTIKNLTDYGAFVDIGGIDGLLHVTDMAWGRLQNPNEQFKPGEHVQIKVLKLDREREKVSLGYKQLIPDPWSSVPEIYPVGAKIKGKISSVTDYGAFVELEPGIEGLVHISEMSWSKRSQHPKKFLNSGEEVEVQVLGIDSEDRRISLGMKQLQPNPWETIGDRYHVGDRVHGRIRNITDFGAFVEVEDGVDGLVHVSDISHSKKIKHPKDVLKKDQEVDAVITSIDIRGRRMSLSIKELLPSAWEAFVATHKPGDTVRGKVSRFAGFGVFVELGSELEGLCHISELSDERVERPEDVVKIGQEMDFKILRIEQDDQKIGLSARAVGKEEEPATDTKSYTTEAKGGMASLAELANLKFGRATEETEASAEEPKLSKKERKALKAQERATAEPSAETETETDSPTSDENVLDEDVSSNEDSSPSTESNEDITPSTESNDAVEESNNEAATKDAVSETSEAVAETEISPETETEPAETNEETPGTEKISSEETSSEETNSKEISSEASDEKVDISETSESEQPLLNDTEGEASLAASNDAPQDEAKTVTEDSETGKAENKDENTAETTEEAEEKTANK